MRSGGTTSPRPEIGRGLFVFRGAGAGPLSATEGSVNVVITAPATIDLVPVMRERLADLETPVSAFAKLRVLGGAFLFESAEGGERMGRFSFIGVAPRAMLYFRDGQVTSEEPAGLDRDPRGRMNLSSEAAPDPLATLRR